ncbi:hypothetical protein C8D87_11482 [Lentzea atacamensis]|uniref:Uncharacterized protein n=1 Tax=Lentzea atacamensis TaxID=531938 RepID=A0ABX9DY97_9PSEU|nr:hypothetical protein [Lentzea atacamensis]RAS59470.1 hypothetical protein C8D87_11482 [Lentzea atacamensis]
MTTMLQRPETETATNPAPIVFTATYADLSAGLQAADIAIATKPVAPVIGGVLLEGLDGRLMLTSCDRTLDLLALDRLRTQESWDTRLADAARRLGLGPHAPSPRWLLTCSQ